MNSIENHQRFPSLSIKPHRLQFFLDQFPLVILGLALIVGHFCVLSNDRTFMGLMWHYGSMYANWGLAIYFVYQYLSFTRIRYVITQEQLIYMHGLIRHATDYMELYRVIDYNQGRGGLQQLFGLKTVVIYSGDRNTPVMEISGVREDVNVVGEIRRRVEYNKKVNHVYEVTNRG